MKTLDTLLIPSVGNFPVRGDNGYAGEQDGSHVEFIGVFCIPSRKAAREIRIGDAIGIQWANYRAGDGWKISLAHWSDVDESECDISQIEQYRCG
jgi:hypothetical protein